MGYDMRIRGEVPTAPEHDIEQAKAAYDAATAALKKRVDAGEFKAALDAWEHRATTGISRETFELMQTEYWSEWITWLELAAEHDGFRVH